MSATSVDEVTDQSESLGPALDVRQFARVLMTDATSGAPMVTGLLACAAAIGLGFIVSTEGLLAGWADPLNLCLTATLYLAPIAAGSVAACVGAVVRSRITWLAASSPRGSRAPTIVTWLGALLWQCVALLVFGALTLVRADLDGPATWPMLLLPAQALLLVIACSAVGMATALRFPGPFTAPAVAGVAFVLFYVLALVEGPLSRFSPVYTAIYYQVYLEPNVALLAGLCVALLGVTLLAMTALVSSRRLLAVGLAVGALTFGLGGALAVAAPSSPVQNRSSNTPPVCDSREGVTLCVWPESRQQLRSSLDALVSVRSSVAPFLDVPATFVEPGVRAPRPGSRTYLVPRVTQSDFVARAVTAVVPSRDCDQPSFQAVGELQAWALERAKPGSFDDPGVSEWATAPVQQQRAWVAERLAIISECS